MRRRDTAVGWAWMRIALPVLGLVALLAAAPAQAAFPGVPGPIAYSNVTIGEGIDTGGLLAHGPRKRDAATTLTEIPTDNSPSYSPNGRLIVFAGNHDPGLAPQGSHIYLMKRDGSGVSQLTSGSFYDSNPSFSPNGKLVVFDRGGLQGRVTHIFSVSTDGSGLRQISDEAGSDYDPTFTPERQADRLRQQPHDQRAHRPQQHPLDEARRQPDPALDRRSAQRVRPRRLAQRPQDRLLQQPRSRAEPLRRQDQRQAGARADPQPPRLLRQRLLHQPLLVSRRQAHRLPQPAAATAATSRSCEPTGAASPRSSTRAGPKKKASAAASAPPAGAPSRDETAARRSSSWRRSRPPRWSSPPHRSERPARSCSSRGPTAKPKRASQASRSTRRSPATAASSPSSAASAKRATASTCGT